MMSTAAYVARGIVRSGSRASSRNTAVASKPMNPVRANRTAMPRLPLVNTSGRNESRVRPDGPGLATITRSRMTTMPISRASATPSTLALRSMWR